MPEVFKKLYLLPQIYLFIISFFIIYRVVFIRSNGIPELIINFLNSFSFIITFLLVVPWTMICYNIRIFYTLTLILILIVRTVAQWNKSLLIQHNNNFKYYLTHSITFILFSFCWIHILLGYRVPNGALDLSSPLKISVVGQGGNSIFINYHQNFKSQKFALDLVKINHYGFRSSKLFSNKLTDFEIYSDTIFSPCDGNIVKLTDGMLDTKIGGSHIGSSAGNHLIIQFKNNLIVLAHIKKNSYLVSLNEKVKKGQPLALVGNSGNSSEPHLHIHAVKGNEVNNFNNYESIPIVFNHHFYVRNDLITLK